MTPELFQQASADIRAMIFHLEELDYKVGVKVYRGVLEKLGIQKDLMDIYDEFDEVYKESVSDKKMKRIGGDKRWLADAGLCWLAFFIIKAYCTK